jgi:hypothetical protein
MELNWYYICYAAHISYGIVFFYLAGDFSAFASTQTLINMEQPEQLIVGQNAMRVNGEVLPLPDITVVLSNYDGQNPAHTLVIDQWKPALLFYGTIAVCTGVSFALRFWGIV